MVCMLHKLTFLSEWFWNCGLQVTHVITASGSIRTIEAVSFVTLQMLLFRRLGGDAVKLPSAFYDIRNGQFVCDNEVTCQFLMIRFSEAYS